MSKKTKQYQPTIVTSPSGAACVMIDPKQVSAMLSCASKDPSRPHLNGLYLEHVGNVTWLCATDGKAAIRIECANPDSVKANLHFARENAGKLAIATAKLTDGIARLDMANDENPPSLASVFPSNQKGCEQAGFDMALFSKVSKAFADLGADGAYLKTLGKQDPAVLTTSDSAAYRIEALILPYRLDK